MTTFAFLKTPNIPNPPEGVEILQNFGRTRIVDVENWNKRVLGEHVIVRGDTEAIRNWLYEYSPIWVTVGSPIMEQFELKEVQ